MVFDTGANYSPDRTHPQLPLLNACNVMQIGRSGPLTQMAALSLYCSVITDTAANR